VIDESPYPRYASQDIVSSTDGDYYAVNSKIVLAFYWSGNVSMLSVF